MNKWQITLKILNSKKSGKCFTRNEIILLFKQYGINYGMGETCMTYINTLVRAGYLDNSEAGVYRKLKKIPDVSQKQLKKSLK